MINGLIAYNFALFMIAPLYSKENSNFSLRVWIKKLTFSTKFKSSLSHLTLRWGLSVYDEHNQSDRAKNHQPLHWLPGKRNICFKKCLFWAKHFDEKCNKWFFLTQKNLFFSGK